MSSTALPKMNLDQATDAEKFRLLVENALDYGIFMLDPQGNVVTWNIGAERIKGYTADEIIGRHFSTFYTPEAVSARWPQEELQLAKAQGRFEDEGWRVRKDGTRFWANVIITAIRDDQGRLIGFAKITRDLTAKRDSQRIEEEGRHIYRFLATLAHELRNPLAPVVNALALMKADPRPETTEWARDLIERQTMQLSRLVDDLLDVQRVATGKILLKNEVLDLRATIKDAVDATRDVFSQRSHELVMNLPDAPVIVDGDNVRLTQVMVNVLTNAAKYTRDGGNVAVTLAARNGRAEVSVRDNGVGIEEHMLTRIFDAFVQADTRLERSQGGLGIGLSLVKELIARHHGTIVALSPGLEQGSEFRLKLPLHASVASIAPTPDAGAATSRQQSVRVLIVDDNPDSADSLALLLEQHGHIAQSCSDPRLALDALHSFRPDVVLLDIGMPGINGYELARAMRKSKGFEKVTLIALTGYGRSEDKALARAAGFDHHFVKPAHIEQLLPLLK